MDFSVASISWSWAAGTPDWGSIPEWLAALSTLAAFAGLRLALRQQRLDAEDAKADRASNDRLLELDRERDRAERARYEEQREREHLRQEREQAMQVTWWIDRIEWWNPSTDDAEQSVRPFIDGSEFYGNHYDPDRYVLVPLVVLNSSSDCVYHAVLKLPDGVSEHFPHREMGVLPPGRSRFGVPADIGLFDASPTQGERHKGDAARNLMVEYIEFRDRDDTIWQRARDGGLTKQEWRPVGGQLYEP